MYELTASESAARKEWQYCKLKCPFGSRARKENCLLSGSHVANEILLKACAIKTL